MNKDIHYVIKRLASFILLIPLTLLSVSGQSPTGVLKIFSENALVVYVDEVHYPQYGEIKLAPGTHWVKAINSEGVRIYSQIVSVKADEVTSVLIGAPQAQPAQPVTGTQQATQPQGQDSGQSVVYGQTAASSGNGQPATATANQPAAQGAVASQNGTGTLNIFSEFTGTTAPDWEIGVATAGIVAGTFGYVFVMGADKKYPRHYYRVDDAAKDAKEYNRKLKEKLGLPENYDVK